MNQPVNTSRPVERAAVGLVKFVLVLLIVMCAVHLYFHLAGAPSTEKPAPIKGASK